MSINKLPGVILLIIFMQILFAGNLSAQQAEEVIEDVTEEVEVNYENIVIELPPDFDLMKQPVIQSDADKTKQFLHASDSKSKWKILIIIDYYNNKELEASKFFQDKYGEFINKCEGINFDDPTYSQYYNIYVLHGTIYCNKDKVDNKGYVYYYSIVKSVTGLHVLKWIFKTDSYQDRNINILSDQKKIFEDFWKKPQICLDLHSKKDMCFPI